MQKIIILAFCAIPFFSQAQHDVLALEKNGMHVRSYTIGDPMTFRTIYGQWFSGAIEDLRRDTIYIAGQAFSYKEIGAIARDRTKFNPKAWGVGAMTVGAGVFLLGAVNGGLQGTQSSQWYSTSGLVLGTALITGGVLLLTVPKKYYTLGGKFQLQYLQIGRQ
jgi:hypothetical protein